MASNFTESVRSRIDRGGHTLTNVIEQPHPHTMVKGLDGQVLNLKASQLLTLHRASASFRQQATGNFQNVLGGGGSIDIPIRENVGHGNVNDLYLRLDVNNGTGGLVQLMPMPFLFSRVEVITNSGTRVQTIYQADLWNDTRLLTPKEWKYWSKLTNASKSWTISDDVIPNGATRSYYMKFPVNFIKNTGILLPHLNGELLFRFFFESSTETVITGTATGLSVTRMELEFDSPFMLQSEFAKVLNKHRSMVHDHRYLFPIEQVFTNQINPNDQIDILLSGFNGLFVDLSFFIRTSNAQLRAKLDYLPIQRYSILDSNGQDMIGGNDEYDGEDEISFSQHYDSDQRRHLNAYEYSFSDAIAKDKSVGTVHGYRPFSGREVLRLYFDPAVQNKVLTLVGGAPSAGNYRYKYKDEYTDWLAFGDLAAVQEAAINALPSFFRSNTTVAVSGLATGATTITFSGQRLQKEEPNEILTIESGIAFDADLDVGITTAFISGTEPAGQYEIVVKGKMIHRLRTTPDGQLSIHSS